MRTRTIKPEFWTDEKLAKVSREARLFFAGLWTTADDQGVTHSNPALLKSQIFPYDDLELKEVKAWIDEFIDLGMLIPYEAENGENYLFIRSFPKYQKIDHPAKTQFNPTPREGLASLSRRSREGYGKSTSQTEFKQKLNLNRNTVPDAREGLASHSRGNTEEPNEEPPESMTQATHLCELMRDKIQNTDPAFKPKSWNRWLLEMERLIRIDERIPEEIERMVNWIWTEREGFWRTVILSAGNLRENYPKILARMKNGGKGHATNRTHSNSRDPREFDDVEMGKITTGSNMHEMPEEQS